MIAVVTDSTAQVPPDLRRRLDIQVVPLTVVVDGVPFADTNLDASTTLATLVDGVEVTTAAPAPGQFLEAYRAAAEAGADGVVSVNIGSFASATVDSARLAGRDSPIPVEIIDSTQVSFGTGCCVWAAAEVAAAGGSMLDVAETARVTAERVRSVFVMDVSFARRSGRLVPAPSAGDGVPVFALHRGELTEVCRAGDVEGATEAMADFTAAAAAATRLRVGVGELHAPEVAEALLGRLKELDEIDEVVRYEVAASVAVHSGSGSAGAFFFPVGERPNG